VKYSFLPIRFSPFAGASLFKKLSVALPDALIHNRAFVAFTKGIQAEHDNITSEWEKLVVDWEADQTRPCPYEFSDKDKSQTFDEVKKQLAEEEHKKLVANHSIAVESSPASFIIEGLRIEEVQ
jgi:hypothetical protein